MKMQRHYMISDDLDDLEDLEKQLEEAGISTPQIHVLSLDDAEVHRHARLHEVQSFMKSDIVHSTTRGALVGVVAAALVLAVAHVAGWTQTAAGWIPFIFLAIIALGFCTWEGGLAGIQRPNHNFTRFARALKDGKHVFFVDLEPGQETVLEQVLARHASVQAAGTGVPTQHWLVTLQKLATMRHA
jgi:hypothetical protein